MPLLRHHVHAPPVLAAALRVPGRTRAAAAEAAHATGSPLMRRAVRPPCCEPVEQWPIAVRATGGRLSALTICVNSIHRRPPASTGSLAAPSAVPSVV